MTNEIYKYEKFISGFFVYLGVYLAYWIAVLSKWNMTLCLVLLIISGIVLALLSIKSFRLIYFDKPKVDN